MQPAKPTRWRAAPTLAVVLGALALGAVAVQAEGPQAPEPAPVVAPR